MEIIVWSLVLTIASLVMTIVLVPPFMSGTMARSFGYSYRTWFIIGFILPFIANIILFGMVTVKNRK